MGHIGILPSNSGGAPVNKDAEKPKTIKVELIKDFLPSLARKIEHDGQMIHRDMIWAMQERRHFYLSTPYVINTFDGAVIPLSMVERMAPDDYNAQISQINYYSSFVNQNVWQLSASKPNFTITSPGDSRKGKASARVMDALVKYVEVREWTERKRQDFALNALLCGTAFIGCGWNPNSGPMNREGVYEEIEVDGVAVKMQTGSREGRWGMPELTVPDPVQFKADLNGYNLKDTMYLRRQRQVAKGLIWQTYPNATLGYSDDSALGEQYQVRQMQATAGMSRTSAGRDMEAVTEAVQLYQYWLHPAMYERMELSEEVRVGDKVIPAGTLLRDAFPMGLYFALVGNEVLDVAPCYTAEEWFVAHLKRVPNRFWGHTYVEEMKLCQDDINRLATIVLRCAEYNANPITIVDGQAIDTSDFTGDGGVLKMRASAMEGRGVDTFIKRLEGSGVSNQVIGFMQILVEAMRSICAAYSPGGAAGSTPNTAEAARIMASTAASSLSPTLDEFASVRVETIRQYLKLFQKYWSTPEAYECIGGDFSVEDIECFLECDVDAFDVTLDERSRMPQTEYDKQVALKEFAATFLVNRQVFTPKELNEFARIYGVHAVGLTDEPDRRRAHDRVKRLEAAFAGLKQDPDLAEEFAGIIEEIIKPQQNLDDHEAMIDEYRSILKSRDAEEMSDEVKAAVLAALDMHVQAVTAQQIQQQQVMAQGQIAANAASQPAEEPPPIADSPVSEEEAQILGAPVQGGEEEFETGGLPSAVPGGVPLE